ncbi:CDP-glucose 4,6-dehydratase [Clostridium sp. CTA-7]
MNRDFYKNRRVLVTGHTGFKGTWLCKTLLKLGAEVIGYSLEPPTSPNLFEISGIEDEMRSYIGDIRDLHNLSNVLKKEEPEVVFHLAAQPIVRDSYDNPVYTFETNVMGTVNILEAIRLTESVKSFVNVTTDKVYKNNEWFWGYREDDNLCGFDPYSNSKSCSELVTESYKNSFLNTKNISISTARAGNVIGGGDFANDRIIPDCIRAAIKNDKIVVRNPNSIRPYQHVLEPIFSYLMIAQKQYEDKEKYSGNYNIGPDDSDCVTTGSLVSIFCEKWGQGQSWENKNVDGPHEANFLKLDCSKVKGIFGWTPTWNIEIAVDKTIEFTKDYINNNDISRTMSRQIDKFMEDRR